MFEDYVTISKDEWGYVVQLLSFVKPAGLHKLYKQSNERHVEFIYALVEALEWAEHANLEYRATLDD